MSTDNYSDELRRVVTVCAGAWSGRHYDDGDSDTLALIFCDRKRNLTRAEQMALMFHQDVKDVLGDNYYGTELSFEGTHRWYSRRDTKSERPSMFYIVGGGQGLYVLKGDDDKPFFLVRDGFIFETTMTDIQERCRLMQKFTADNDGCRCTWRGDRCVHTWHTPGAVGKCHNGKQVRFAFMDDSTPFQPTEAWLENIYALDKEEWEDHKKIHRVRNWKSELAGHVVIPPTATDSDHLRPTTKAIRLPFHCNFTQLESARDDFSLRTQSGAETRRTIDKECRHCYFGGEWGPYSGQTKKTVHPCVKWFARHCKHGKWTEERLVDYTLERFGVSLEKRSQLTLNDAWTVAQLAGIPFKVKAGQTGRPREWQICRISEEYQGQKDKAVRILVSRTARDARDLTLKFVSIAELREFLPQFMLEQMDHVAKKPIDRAALALWAHASTMSCGKSRTGYFSTDDGCGFTSWQAKVGSVFFTSYLGVRVQLCYSRREDYLDFGNLRDLRDYTFELPLFNITEAEDDSFVPSLHHWMR